MIRDDLFLVLSQPPQGFPTRKIGTIGTCAMYSLKALIEGYNPKIIQDQKFYSSSLWAKITGFMLPKGVAKVLRKNNVPYEIVSGKGLSYNEKINLLKSKLHHGPIFLLIGNSYCGKKDPKFWRALIHWHYITVRGFDEPKQLFFVYDSNQRHRIYRDVPIGNTFIPYKQMINDRSRGASGLVKCFGISVKYR